MPRHGPRFKSGASVGQQKLLNKNVEQKLGKKTAGSLRPPPEIIFAACLLGGDSFLGFAVARK